MSLDQLSKALVTPSEGTPTSWMMFLHGILGSGANWRTVARRFVAARPAWGATLVDLRKHAGVTANGIVGHSFGGKVALEYARSHSLSHLFLVDSNPGARLDARGSEGTVKVLEMLEGLPATFPSRQAFTDYVLAQGHGLAIAQWLAMNLERDGDVFSFGLEVSAIRELLTDYFARDLWSVLESPSDTRFVVILGGKSNVFDDADRERLAGIASKNANVEMFVVEGAGHWVHAEAPDELHQILVNATG